MACVCASSLPEHEQVYFVGFAAQHGELRKVTRTFCYVPPNALTKIFEKMSKKKKKKKNPKTLSFLKTSVGQHEAQEEKTNKKLINYIYIYLYFIYFIVFFSSFWRYAERDKSRLTFFLPEISEKNKSSHSSK